MASGNFSKAPVSGLELYCIWSSQSDTLGNYSTVKVQAYLRHYSLQSGSMNVGISCNGETLTSKSPVIRYSDNAQKTTWIAEQTFTVPHNDNGSKSVPVSVYWDFNGTYSGVSIGRITASTTAVLDDIPRASQPSLITFPDNTEYVGDMGRTITVHMNSHSSDFRHYVYAVFGNSRVDIAYSVKDNVDWTIPLDFALQVPNSVDGWGTVNVETYKDTTLIGTKSCWFCAAVPANMVPSIGGVSWGKTSNEPANWPMTQSVSKGVMSMSGVSGSYGSTISTYSLTFAGLSSTSPSLSVDNIASSGRIIATAKVTDSRNRTTVKEVAFDVAAYIKPQLTTEVYRCDASGNEDDSGEYMYAKATATVSPVADNSIQSMVLQYKKPTDAEYTSVALTNGNRVIVEVSSDYTWDWVITVSDKVNPVSYSNSISTGDVVLDILANGNGIAFGKVAEEEGVVDTPWEFKSNGAKIDVPVERGTSGVWTYEKWASGKSVCYGSKQYQNLSTPQQWGSGFFADILDFDAFPAGCFNAQPIAFTSILGNGLRSVQVNGVTQSVVHLRVIDMGNQANDAIISVYVVGRWK